MSKRKRREGEHAPNGAYWPGGLDEAEYCRRCREPWPCSETTPTTPEAPVGARASDFNEDDVSDPNHEGWDAEHFQATGCDGSGHATDWCLDEALRNITHAPVNARALPCPKEDVLSDPTFDPSCIYCDYDIHVCHGCGEPLRHDGKEFSGTQHKECT